MTTKEQWKPVSGHSGFYEVSSIGRVRALFSGNNGQLKPGRVLKPEQHQNKYLFVTLYKPGVGKVKARSIHSLVLEAFVGPRPKDAVSRHLDGNRTHNTVGNLAWGTISQNYDDSRGHGTNCEGERNGGAKLKQQEVVAIIRMRTGGATYKAIGLAFGTHWSNAWLICNGKSWKNAIVNA